MAECFGSWQGFLDAGFVAEEDGYEDSDIEDGATEDGTLDELEEDGAGCASSDDWSSCLREIVKRRCKGIGTISAEQYDALCKHMAINGLRQREKRG